MLLLAGAAPLTLFVDFDTALHLWAVIVSPLLHVAAMLAFIWAMGPLLTRQGLFYASLMMLVQASIVAQFLPGRPDHHSFQALLFILLIGATLRMIAHTGKHMPALIAAAIASLAIWTSVEGLVAVALSFAALALLWIIDGKDIVRASLLYAVLMVLCVAIAIAIERPPQEWLIQEYDRISAVHLYLFSFAAMFWIIIAVAGRFLTAARDASSRGLFILATATILFGIFWYLFPAFFAGPMVGVPERVVQIWNTQVAEYQSAIDFDHLSETIYLPFLFLGAALPAFLYLPFLIAFRDAEMRRPWIFFLIALIVFLPLSIYQLRWGIYAQILALPIYAELLLHVLRSFKLEQSSPGLRAALARVGIILVFAGTFTVLGRLAAPETSAAAVRVEPAASSADCDLAQLGRYLADPSNGWRPRQKILALIFFGPELQYRTPHSVVATPNHRNAVAILDTIGFFSATDAATAREIAARRQIDLVLVCPDQPEEQLYINDDKTTLYDNLIDGKYPTWLKRVELPASVNAGHMLFEFAR